MPESSPRMRGKVKVTAFEWSEIGITPAHAGKRSRASFRKSTARDHPRACGEKSLALPPTTSVLGSPPRTRGKVEIRKKTNQVVGITPAHAGKRFVSVSRNSAVRDHPRACGEKGPLADMKESLPGSPPRLRGKVTIPVKGIVVVRITPAHAGKRFVSVLASGAAGDHPRACGEKQHNRWETMDTQGGDHPRACGEKHPILRHKLTYSGSPPRMRGKGIISA